MLGFWLAITTYLIIQFLLNFITNSCLGSQTFAIEKDWTDIIWNNCEISIDNKPGHYQKLCYEAGIVFTQDLLFNLNVADEYNRLSKKSIQKVFYIPETFTSHLYKKYNLNCFHDFPRLKYPLKPMFRPVLLVFFRLFKNVINMAVSMFQHGENC